MRRSLISGRCGAEPRNEMLGCCAMAGLAVVEFSVMWMELFVSICGVWGSVLGARPEHRVPSTEPLF